MGLIGSMLSNFLQGERNVLRETAEVFRENAEAAGQRAFEYDKETLAQFSAEFAGSQKGWFDSLIDGLNRLPRPFMALAVIFLLASAMTSPVWFASRMQGLSLVPEPLWWLMGVIVSFYFGARQQVKAQQFQKSIAETLSRTPKVVANIAALRGLDHNSPGVADTGNDAELTLHATAREPENAAIAAWRSEPTPPQENT